MKKLKYFLLIFILLFTLCPIYSMAESNSSIDTTNTSTDVLTTNSPACILIEAKTGKVLYQKNAYESKYPASTTKMMTAILTLENCELTDTATVNSSALLAVPYSYVTCGIKEGEVLTIEQLLNVLLIPSANDAANVLAEHVSGSVEEFAKLMNEKAKEIGCLNTHFVNPNGVHNKNHTTTAYDLALIGRYAMQNPTFRQFVQKTQYTLPATNKYDKADRYFTTTNELLIKNDSKSKSNYYYKDAIGIKTGYTGEAGSCIVAGAKRDNMEVIAVILGGGTTKDGLSQRYLDCINLFNYAFDNYKMEVVNEKNSVLEQIKIPGATSDTKNLDVLVKDEISILTKQTDALDKNNAEIVYNEDLKAPISLNSTIGKITYTVDGITYSSDLIAGQEVVASKFLPILIRAILIAVTLYLIYILLKRPNGKQKGTKKYSKSKHSNKSKGSGSFRFTTINNIK